MKLHNFVKHLAQGLKSISKAEPFIINLIEPDGAYVQAIIAKSGKYLVEVSGNNWLAKPLTRSQEAKFRAFGWELNKEVSNYYMEFESDFDTDIIATIVALTVSEAFHISDERYEELDPFWPNMEELEQMEKDNIVFWAHQFAVLQLAEHYNDVFKEILIRCEKCKQVFWGRDAKIEWQGETAELFCPDCDTKFKTLTK